jgi:hypothetical protein
MNKLTWYNETRRLGDLIPWPRNPRKINDSNSSRLLESLEQFDQVETIAVGPDGEVYNGHQRLKVWGSKFGPDLQVAVRVASRPLDEKEREKLTVYLHKGATGDWDFELLANFDMNELLEWGFDAEEFATLSESTDQNSENNYSRKIETPIYEPSGEKPEINILFDDTKTNELKAEISLSDLTDDVKKFLMVAADRHTVFNFKKIADYYAHSDKKTQDLMEKSALVIIDFDKAIEYGFVELTENIRKQYVVDYPGGNKHG